MKSLKVIIGIISILGITATGTMSYAAQENQENSNLSSDKNEIKKNITPVVMLLEKPGAEDTGQYVTLSDSISQKSQKQLTVRQSFDVKSAIIFSMGRFGLSAPSGFTTSNAKTGGRNITFLYGDNRVAADRKTFDLSLGSQFLIEPSSIMSALFDGSEFDNLQGRSVYNLSASMGYSGFNIGASFSRERMLFESGMKGFDVGLGYSGRNWGADVKFGEYKRERDRLFAPTEEFYDTVQALEVGAEYRLFANIRFTGRFTYYAYGEQNDLGKLKNSQVFFLGTNVNF